MRFYWSVANSECFQLAQENQILLTLRGLCGPCNLQSMLRRSCPLTTRSPGRAHINFMQPRTCTTAHRDFRVSLLPVPTCSTFDVMRESAYD